MVAVRNTDAGYYIPMDVIAAMFLTVSCWNCQIPRSQAQSVKYAFPIYRSSSFYPTQRRASVRERCKDKEKNLNSQTFYKENARSHCSHYSRNDGISKKRSEKFRHLETKYYLCSKIRSYMGETIFKLALLVEAQSFLNSLPQAVADKMTSRII